ncbi:orotate phosphoribosyltransferase [Candidatus Nanohalococcus occultus]
MDDLCGYCGQKKATESCEVCGSNVCSNCKLEYGCKVCGGGTKSF